MVELYNVPFDCVSNKVVCNVHVLIAAVDFLTVCVSHGARVVTADVQGRVFLVPEYICKDAPKPRSLLTSLTKGNVLCLAS